MNTHFKTLQGYRDALATGLISNDDIAYIDEGNAIYTHGRAYGSAGNGGGVGSDKPLEYYLSNPVELREYIPEDAAWYDVEDLVSSLNVKTLFIDAIIEVCSNLFRIFGYCTNMYNHPDQYHLLLNDAYTLRAYYRTISLIIPRSKGYNNDYLSQRLFDSYDSSSGTTNNRYFLDGFRSGNFWIGDPPTTFLQPAT